MEEDNFRSGVSRASTSAATRQAKITPVAFSNFLANCEVQVSCCNHRHISCLSGNTIVVTHKDAASSGTVESRVCMMAPAPTLSPVVEEDEIPETQAQNESVASWVGRALAAPRPEDVSAYEVSSHDEQDSTEDAACERRRKIPRLSKAARQDRTPGSSQPARVRWTKPDEERLLSLVHERVSVGERPSWSQLAAFPGRSGQNLRDKVRGIRLELLR